MKNMKQSNFGDIPKLSNKTNDAINIIDYEHKLENISLEEAEKQVLDRLGFIKTKPGVGMFWTKKTKSVNFLDEKGKTLAIYNQTVRDFWWVE